jgi:segregation and condensation protein B
MSLDQLQMTLFPEGDPPEKDELKEALDRLQQDYAERALELVEVASGFRFQVRQSMEPWVSRLWEEKPARYSRALLETLALIAYRQPITRAEIEDVRGVSVSSSIIKTLQDREWIRVVGHRDVPGRPAVYGTTREFLDYFGLKSLDELPTLAELRDIDSINAELDLGVPGMPVAVTEGEMSGEDEPDAGHEAAELSLVEVPEVPDSGTEEDGATEENGEEESPAPSILH